VTSLPTTSTGGAQGSTPVRRRRVRLWPTRGIATPATPTRGTATPASGDNDAGQPHPAGGTVAARRFTGGGRPVPGIAAGRVRRPPIRAGPQPSYGYQPSTGQPSFGDGQPFLPGLRRPRAGGRARRRVEASPGGFTYQGTTAPAPRSRNGDDHRARGPRRPLCGTRRHTVSPAATVVRPRRGRRQHPRARQRVLRTWPTPARATTSRGTSSPAMTTRATRRMAAPSRSRRAWSLRQAPSITGATPSLGSRTRDGRQGQYQEYGYGQQADQQESRGPPPGPALRRVSRAQPPAAAPQQWQGRRRARGAVPGPGTRRGNGGGRHASRPPVSA